MVVRRRPITLSLLALCALLPFQNCGKQMEANNYDDSNSQQCKAQLKAEAIASKSAPAFNCSEFNNYSCERRVFSPDVESLSHLLKECTSSGEICVDVEVRQFNTASAKSSEPASAFLPGGEYNREEFRCHHKYTYRGVAVFEGEGDSIEEALASAMKSCESAGSVEEQ